jgi:AraC-like DNA-binding protein
LTGCDHFALLAFRQCRLADLGVIGELARNCATVGEALSTLTAYQQLNAESGAVYLLQETNTIAMGYAVFHPGVIDAHLAQEAVMAIIANVVRELAGYEADFVKLDLPRFSPPDSTPYQQYFHCPLRFNAQRAALRLPLSLMSRPVIGANESLKRQLLQQAERQLEPAFESQLYRSLSSLLMTGLPPASGDAVAQQFAMHRRTFNRRLMAMGTTFQSVLDDVRFNVARQLLRETLLPITEIALTLGYSESSAFGRAFRRWSGQTPRDWRDIEQGQ